MGGRVRRETRPHQWRQDGLARQAGGFLTCARAVSLHLGLSDGGRCGRSAALRAHDRGATALDPDLSGPVVAGVRGGVGGGLPAPLRVASRFRRAW
jgi:hypothetical protein